MKTINLLTITKLTVISIFTTILFTSCDGGGSDASFSNGEQKDDISIDCVTTPNSSNIDTYIDLYSGDTIVKIDENASISIYHDINGTKKVCKETGSSYILRAN